MYEKRLKGYRTIGYEVEVEVAGGADANW